LKRRKHHILVDTLGLLIASRVEPAGISDRRAGEHLVYGLAPLWPEIRTNLADAGHESRWLARLLYGYASWQLQVAKRHERALKIKGLTWIVERTFAWLRQNRRFSKAYEYKVQTSKMLIGIAAAKLRLDRLTTA
jgi:putative transposase